jgi:DNA-binding LytR/AlgR family response regulator
MVKLSILSKACDIMKIAICDDCTAVAQELKSNIESICAQKDWPLETAVYTSPAAILQADLSKTQVVFLDIDMPQINGLEVAKQLRARFAEIIIVFVTSYIEYAPEGYRVNAFRYLLKQRLDSELCGVMCDVYQKLTESSRTISIRTKSEIITLPINRILYIEGTAGRKVLFHTETRYNVIHAVGRLASYGDELKDKGFLKLQKSFIANMAHILKINNYHVYMSNGEVLKASELNYKEIQTAFLQWKGLHL